MANLSQEIHESIDSEQSNYSVPHPTADSYPSLSQLCNEIDLSIDAGLLVQAETLEDELTRQYVLLLQVRPKEKCSVC